VVIYFALLAGIGVGYAIGRVRPFDALCGWTESQVRFHLDRWNTAPKQAALFGLLLLADPKRVNRARKAARIKGKG
jgi:hypothetical protein